MATVACIQIHPIKALDAVRVEHARLLGSGALELDRRWALFDAKGNFINGKRKAAIHQVRATYDLAKLEVTLGERTYSLIRQPDPIAEAFSEILNEPVQFKEDAVVGFPDDTDSPGPTLVTQASLRQVAEWFGFDFDQTRLRFRTNLEIAGAEPFWEDRLYGATVRIGEAMLEAVNPCQRCIVPSRDPRPEGAIPAMEKNFSKRFSDLRQQYLPAWADPAPFNHFYRFAVNTRAAAGQAGKMIRTGDEVSA